MTDPAQDDTHRLERELQDMAAQNRFDYVIVDSNPDLGYLTTLSLLCWPALKVIIPAFAEEASREAILELYDTIRVLERQDFNAVSRFWVSCSRAMRTCASTGIMKSSCSAWRKR